MAQIAAIGAGANTATTSKTTSAASYYGPFAGVFVYAAANTTEGLGQVKNRGASTLQNININVITNARVAASTFSSRKNTAAGNQSVSVGAGATGVFTDNTHTDSLADGDLYNYNWLTATDAGAHALAVSSAGAQLSMAGQAFVILNTGSYQSSGTGLGQSSTAYSPFAGMALTGSGSFNTTETNAQQPAIESATLSNMYFAGASSTSNGAQFRKNTANGNQVHPGTTGNPIVLEDTTHTDSVVSGDVFNMKQVTGSFQSYQPAVLAVKYLGSTTNQCPLYGGGALVTGTGATAFWPPAGVTSNLSTEAATQFACPSAGTLSTAYAKLTVNTIGSGQTWQVRINGSNGNQAVSLTASTTGVFKDITHTDSVAVGDLLSFSTASTFTASATVSNYGLLFATSPGTTTLTLDLPGPVEAEATIAADATGRPETGAGLASDGAGRVETGQGLAGDNSGRIEAGAGVPGGIASPAEFGGGVAGSLPARLDWVGQLLASTAGPVESGALVQRDGGALAETGASEARDLPALVESGGGVVAGGAGPLDLGAGVAAGMADPVEIHGTLQFDAPSVRIETGASVQLSASVGPVETAAGVIAGLPVLIEFGGALVITLDGVGPIEFGALVRRDSPGGIEVAAMVLGAGAGPLELGAGVRGDAGGPIETAQRIATDDKALVEFLGSLAADGTARIDWVGLVAKDGGTLVDFSALLQVDSSGRVETGAGVAADATGRPETGRGVAGDTRGPVTTLASILADFKALIETAPGLMRLRRIVRIIGRSR